MSNTTTSPTVAHEPFTVPLDESGATDRSLTGGKGANLARLRAADLPVPPGFCVTTAAYREFVDALGLQSAIGSLDSLDPGETAAIADRSAEIRAAIHEHSLPGPVRDAVVAALETSDADSFAVRSSATAEDLPSASFAGQHESFLGVSGETAVTERVRDCFASLFTERAVAYRLRNDVSHDAVEMAVVVQAMVDPDVAGVCFTADPLTGNRHVASVDANYGLGDTVVAGDVSPDNVRVDRRTGEILEYAVGEKGHARRASSGDGTETVALSPDERTSRALSAAEVRDLLALCEDVESSLAGPQDVEWALVDGEFVVLQSRPITSLYPVPEPAPGDDSLHVYFSIGHQQAMADALPPLVVDYWRTFGNDAAERVRPAGGPPLVVEAGHRVYADLTPFLRSRLTRGRLVPLLRSLSEPGAAALADLLDRRGDDVPRQGALATLRSAGTVVSSVGGSALPVVSGMARRGVAAFLSGPPDAETVRLECEAGGKRLASRIGEPDALADRVERAFEGVSLGDLLVGVGARSVPRLVAGLVAGWLLERLFPDATEELDALGKGFEDEIATRINQDLGDIADIASRHPEVQAALADGDTLAELARVDGGEEFVAAFEAFLDDFGSRAGSEIDLHRPRWRDDPATLLRTVRSRVAAGDPGQHRTHLEELRREATEAARTLESRAGRGLLGPVERPLVRRLIETYRGGIQLREHHKHGASFVLAAVRDVVTEAGERLADDGRLERAADVWYLRRDELVAALRSDPHAGRDPLLDVSVDDRRRAYERHRSMTAPPVITSEGEIPAGTGGSGTGTSGDSGTAEQTLTGTPVSSGVVEGPARVVSDPASESVDDGDVLVAPSTDVGWTPLFQNAAALVMEVGGQMTHGSLVAREYGIPAVVSVSDATTTIRSGERVRVDGTRGTVELLDRTQGPAADDGDTSR